MRKGAPKTKVQQARLEMDISQEELVELIEEKAYALQKAGEASKPFQEWLDRFVNMDIKTVKQWESGKCLPNRYYRRLLVLVFNKTLAELGLNGDSSEGNEGIEQDSSLGTMILKDQEAVISMEQLKQTQEKVKQSSNGSQLQAAELIQPSDKEDPPQEAPLLSWQQPSLPGNERESDISIEQASQGQPKSRKSRRVLQGAAIAGLLLFLVGIVIFSAQALPRSSQPGVISSPSATGPSGQNPWSCYDQKQHIGPITVSSTVLRLSTAYVVDPKSLCLDINFRPAQQNRLIEARVVFLDKKTGDVKGYGQWKPLASSTWMVLATSIVKGTHYTLEFFTRSGNNDIVEGDLAA